MIDHDCPIEIFFPKALIPQKSCINKSFLGIGNVLDDVCITETMSEPPVFAKESATELASL